YSIYFTIPEWDSYSNIQSVRQSLLSGSLVANYRPLFNASMTITSISTTIDPYTLFPILLIAAQSSLLFVIFLLRSGTKNRVFNNLLMVSVLAVPVINMEVDIPRAQSILIALMPIFFYYLNKYYSSKNNNRDFALLLWMSVVCLSYHEFFSSLTLLTILLLTTKLINSWRFGDKKDKSIVLLTIAVVFLSILIGYNYIFTFKVAVGNMQIILNSLLHNLSLKWWFLNNGLSADHMAVAWIGWKSVLMYYAYYLSPVILCWLVLMIKTLFKKQKISSFQYCLLFVGGLFFAFAEILPRMNIGILPERSWLFFDVVVLIFIASYLNETKTSRLKCFVISALAVVGMAGTFYVAVGKKSLTSSVEMKAANWINVNTAKDSIFISQQANNQLINFFGERKILSPNSDYFLSDELIKQEEAPICESFKTIPSMEKTKNELSNFDIQKGDIKALSNSIISTRSDIQKYNELCFPKALFTYAPIYVLFSQEKLQGIYSTREWWRDVNYYGAKLDKFNSFPVVYDNGGVKIWRLR
ncbi:MAG: hypothetical protein C0412_02875, partial [Flavobacterium sp.]|nr:hypothetical protein [Flavobacterium sp.]